MNSHESSEGRILCLGSVNIDGTESQMKSNTTYNHNSLIKDVFSVPHIVRVGETLPASAYKVSAGGKGANQSVAASRAGAHTLHAGKIGTDGVWVKQMMQADYGVDCSYLLEDTAGNQTGRAVIQVSQQQSHDNAILLFPGTNHLIHTADVQRIFEQAQFRSGEWLMLQNEINVEAMQAAINAAHERRMIITINPAPMTSDFSTQCPLDKVNVLVLNEVEASDLFSQLFPETVVRTTTTQSPGEFLGAMQTVLNALCNHFPDPMCGIIITLGAEGLIAKFRTGPDDEWTDFRVPAYPTKVVDTTGAGDTFIGYFVAAMLRETQSSTGSPTNQSQETMQIGPRFDASVVERSLRLASMASSVACSRPGAMPSIPKREEVNLID